MTYLEIIDYYKDLLITQYRAKTKARATVGTLVNCSVCDFDRCHYFSFDGNEGVLVVEYRDDFYIEKLIESEKFFYDCMITFTDPG